MKNACKALSLVKDRHMKCHLKASFVPACCHNNTISYFQSTSIDVFIFIHIFIYFIIFATMKSQLAFGSWMFEMN